MATFEFADCVRTDGAVLRDNHIDWPATMRDCVAKASVLADRVAASDSNAGEALQRLCNVVTCLLDSRGGCDTKEIVVQHTAEGGVA